MNTKESDGKDKVLYITHGMELLAWLFIVLIVVAISTLAFVYNQRKDSNTYKIFLPDVDGLIVGSPVRILGIQVGYVTTIEPVKDEVFVKFIITNKDIVLPQGTQATVEFSGMAGSKSLELYPPKEGDYIDSQTPLLMVTPPKRLHDAAGLLREMFNQLGNIIHTVSSFTGEMHKIDIPSGAKTGSIKDFFNYSDSVTDRSIIRMETLRKELEKYGK